MKLGDVIELGKSKTILIENEVEYRIAGVSSYGLGIRNRRFEFGQNLKMKKYQIIEEDYLMWCKVDTKNGAFGITKSEHLNSLASTNMCLAKVNKDKIYPDFLEFLFRFKPFYENITKLSSGTTNRKYLTPVQLCETITIPNLTLEQQKEFLLKQENLEDINLHNEVIHQLSLISQLRQAFLKEAMQGKLVSNETSDGKTGSDLLTEIETEKEKLIKEKKIKKGNPLPAISEDEIPFDVPENWIFCKLGNLFQIVRGSSPRPKGDIRYFPKFRTQYHWITIADFAKNSVGNILMDTSQFLSLEGSKQSRIVTPDDLLVAASGVGSVGKSSEIGITGFIYDGLMAIKNIKNKTTKKYISFYLKVKELEIYSIATGANWLNINTDLLNNYILPLPPLEIQNRIVSKLEELMTYCDDLETSVKESQNYNEQLLQQVLREALEVKEVVGQY